MGLLIASHPLQGGGRLQGIESPLRRQMPLAQAQSLATEAGFASQDTRHIRLNDRSLLCRRTRRGREIYGKGSDIETFYRANGYLL